MTTTPVGPRRTVLPEGPETAPAAPTAVPAGDAARRTARVSWYAAARHALDRPLTSYYLLLGASALLLTIGLIMVLSASSVYSFRVYDDSYAIVEKQLLWVAIAVPCAWVASRLPLRWIRRVAYPGYAISLTLLLLTAFLGVSRNGNTNWLALGPIVMAGVVMASATVWARAFARASVVSSSSSHARAPPRRSVRPRSL